MELNIQEIEKEKDSNNKNNKNKRKQISYDDLLSNMGFKLNNGKLELYNKKIDQNANNKQNNYSKSYTNNLNIQENIKETQPMTKIQYKRLLQLQYLQNMKERERINNIKSKKLLFSNPLTINNINQSISVPNKFFNFSR